MRRLTVREYRLRLLFNSRGIDSDGFQSRRCYPQGEGLSCFYVPAPDRRPGFGFDLLNQACADQLLRDISSGAAFELRRRGQAVIVALRRRAEENQLGVAESGADPKDFVVFRSLDIVLALAVDRKPNSSAASLRRAPDQAIDGAKVPPARGAPPTSTLMLASEPKASRIS